MKYYTETIPISLAEKLREKGMVMEENGKSMIDWKVPTYADTIDWFMTKKNISIILYRMTQNFRIALRKANNGILLESIWDTDANDKDTTWHEAANVAINKALELIKED